MTEKPASITETLPDYSKQGHSLKTSQHFLLIPFFIYNSSFYFVNIATMFEIPNMSLDTARDELGDGFARRIDVDFKHSKCIWCKAGGTKTKKKNHSLMNCPTTKPAENDQTSLSNEIFNAGEGEGDAAIACIHKKTAFYVSSR